MNKKEFKAVTLPYDFVPFVKKDKCEYPYTIKRELPDKNNRSKEKHLPKHNSMDKENLSGVLSYKITPRSDLAIEVRENVDGKKFISGSIIRGKIRSNMEILGACYPEFIDKTPLIYRNFDNIDIERSIQVGFLYKEGNDYYVVPAKQIFYKANAKNGTKIKPKNFCSIKEHRLKKMGVGTASGNFSFIYKWEHNIFKKINRLQEKIENLSKEIARERKKNKEILDKGIQQKISNVFTNYSFINKDFKELKEIKYKIKQNEEYDYKREVNQIKIKIKDEIDKVVKKEGLDRLIDLTIDRWGLKLEIDFIYSFKIRKKNSFRPYQRNVFFKRNENNGIEKISFSPDDKETMEEGYLFNSTNATSKRSHYFVLGPDATKESLQVPQNVINSYNLNFDKFRPTSKGQVEKIKAFYNIFNKDELDKHKENGLIVFYKLNNKDKIENIGRTPYFKIEYKNQLEDIINSQVGEAEKEKVDYVNALFGFIRNENEKEKTSLSYKSRLRFTPADISGKNTIKQDRVDKFLLMTPYASSCGMYLKQFNIPKKLGTYKDKDIELNGYKYYHVLEEIKPPKKQGLDNMVSSKRVLIANGFVMNGKIYFNNLTKKELGLLLLSVDWRLLDKSKYKDKIEKYNKENAYELIGGAKPYGYGKVNIEVENIELEKKSNDFESLVEEPMKKTNSWGEYINEFINDMGNDYFNNVYFDRYVQSKMENSFTYSTSNTGDLILNWDNVGDIIKEENRNKGGGYPKNWCLKRR